MKSHEASRAGGQSGATVESRTVESRTGESRTGESRTGESRTGESRTGESRTGESRCAGCGAQFHCGIDDAGGCWCAKLPPLPRAAHAGDAGCLCEACLQKLLGAAPATPSETSG